MSLLRLHSIWIVLAVVTASGGCQGPVAVEDGARPDFFPVQRLEPTAVELAETLGRDRLI